MSQSVLLLHQEGPSGPPAKDPPVQLAEKLFSAILSGDLSGVYSAFDPKVVLSGPMGIFHGRPQVKGWLQFEHSIMKRVGLPMVVSKISIDSDGGKGAIVTWHVGSFFFTDVVSINQVNLIKSIKRTWQKRKLKDEKVQEASRALLLAWTGPHFERYCMPKSASGIDRRALVLPVIDFSFCGIRRARDMLTAHPRDAKTLIEREVVLHYLESVAEEAKQRAQAQQASSSPKDAALHFGTQRKDEITIRAKNRDGDQAAIVIDRASLLRAGARGGKSAVDSLDDNDVFVNEDRVRYVGSSLKLNNNEMVSAGELNQVIRLVVFNAFYFLNWIDLSTNMLTQIPDLTTFAIHSLYLHDNQISDWDELEKLGKLEVLHTLTLFGNPIQATSTSSKEYKFKALMTIKGPKDVLDMPLRTFDHCVLSKEERENIDRFAAMKLAARRPSSRAAAHQR